MAFYVWTCIGIAVGIVHLLVPGRHRLGLASAMALGIVGAWNGALVVSALGVRQGGWIFFGPIAVAGAIVGAVGAVAGIDFAADRMRDGVWAAGRGEDERPADRARLHA